MEEEKKTENQTGNENKAVAEKQAVRKKKGRKRRVVRRVIWTVVILAVLGVAGWSVYSRLRADYKITYDPYTATTGSISNSLSFTGSMQLVSSASYAADADTKVREVYVAAGDSVKEGAKLMRLANGTTFTADFDGTVSVVNAGKGDSVKAEESLLTLADFDHMKVSVRIGESNISEVSVGMPCKVTVSSANASLDSTIAAIDYSTYTGNNVAYYTATVYADTSAADNLWPGMQATVTVVKEEAENVTVLKMEALSTARDNTAFVYKENEKGEMEQTPVTVGVSNGNYVEIKDGVTAGETVYKVAEKEEELTGLAALFSGMFTNRQVNRPSRGNWSGSGSGSGGMPDFGNMPDGGGFPGGSGQRNSNGGSSGGSRGN